MVEQRTPNSLVRVQFLLSSCMKFIHSGIIKISLCAGKAIPNSTVSSQFGSKGINPLDFCKKFNNVTKHIKLNIPLSVHVFFKSNKIKNIVLKGPTVTNLLLYIFNISNFSKTSIDNIVISNIIIKKIIGIKLRSFNTMHYKRNYNTIIGNLKSIGLLNKS